MGRFAKAVDQLLVWFILFQMIALTAVVIFAVLARLTGNSLSWYDEIAAIQLAWLTYYGGAYAALHRRHIGFDSVLLSIPMPFRGWAVIFAEAVVIGFFVLLAYLPNSAWFGLDATGQFVVLLGLAFGIGTIPALLVRAKSQAPANPAKPKPTRRRGSWAA